MASDFIYLGEDYVDYIKTEEDLKLFQRLKELESKIENKKIFECMEAFQESVQLDRKLKGLPPVKFTFVNPNADLLN